ncbi:hypothetical protein PHYBLDRAFT_72743 [Phycomyces blakesleeanus NRRL 1555(-)]|uniref:Protein FAR1-RELATED SEQUENCE n=1 Tax=Phycomyces blakesleeanus (strain ATCC 8743b / DSM 1359 / FGSC 10004 / NBRC 33097 / NRRL 1555) TaxID=763407 RepID=A0A162X070_PHYB8|nr:hypothetical protein PHYBLDRAFT_72743 [Phycomyces blakesleeanus NRRL 1555(-)]OAD71775.1 hypothetical protein PHYBLDRAFT_72743 [Phycomyces blakesleeanus NRRL 1555(-)]|eukprot:XP_018289815.1 hypothetical protein PHYBLDRAFT_72743 [Phycomyces blakesleeanus NRRL 1555(-)]
MKEDENGDRRGFLDELASHLDQIALKCTTSEEEKKEIDAYLRFAKDNCKDQGKSAKAFLERKMHDKENWVNTYVFKHPHFGNRTSNRAESSHASLKHALGTSSGKLKTVTMKVAKWSMIESAD